MQTILFHSTNRDAPRATFKEALLKGQAPDGGLYMPEEIPPVARNIIREFRGQSYPEIAFTLVRPFIPVEQIDDGSLRELVGEAYNFPVPVESLAKNLFLLRLDRGPTASFKDFAMRWMARIMASFAARDGRSLTVLVATSGDTGGAAADAFYRLPGMRVVVLFPEREVSDRQRRQMTTLGGNVTAIAVRGKFDDCQALVKRAFNDPACAELNLTSANSINFGRLLPQMIYYFYAASRIPEGTVSFSVPSGNFGNLMGGVFARARGLAVEKFVVAVNENDEFPRFLADGRYAPVVPSRECSSNAMNVGNPGNLARLVELYGGWLLDERNEKGDVVKRGVLREQPDMDRMRRDFLSFSVPEAGVDETIRMVWREYGILLEPHGAVAVAAAMRASLPGPVVIHETADPAKFPEKIRDLLGVEPPVTPSLLALDGREETFGTMGNSFEEFRKVLKNL